MGHRVPAARIVFSSEDRRVILGLIDQSLRTGSLTLGPHTENLEEAFARRHEVGHAVAMSSGTSALETILRILAVEGREVVVPTNTFFATAAAVVHAGGIPRLADVSSATLALSAESLTTALTPETRAVVLVHVGGIVTPEVDAIRAMCDRNGVTLVEDAAHAHGASFQGRSAGTFGKAAAFSFYPTKVMTSGEGGMIATDDIALREEAVVYRDQGKAAFVGGDHVRMGYSWRMSELNAAVGLVHLGRLDEAIATRRRVAAHYDEALSDVPGCRPFPVPSGSASNYYKYVMLLDPGIDRSVLKLALADQGVSLSGEVYSVPLHRQPIFAGLAAGSFPVADDVCARHICLPVHSDMTDGEVDYVVDSLSSTLRGLARAATR